MNHEFANDAIFLAFDFGMRNIGVAIGQKITNTASPLPIIKANHGEPQWHEITKIIEQWRPAALVVGVPVHLNGTEHRLTRAARGFIEKLRQHYPLPVFSAEERLTTKDAKERVFTDGGYKALCKEDIDSIAAKLILEEWMNLKKRD